MDRKVHPLLLGSIAVLELITQANAAPIAQCVLKSYSEIKAVPIPSRVLSSLADELRVDLLEEFGTRWVWSPALTAIIMWIFG